MPERALYIELTHFPRSLTLVLFLLLSPSTVPAAEDPQGLARQAETAFRAGDLDGAAALAERVLALDARSAGAHLILGSIRGRERKWELAAEHFAAVIELAPASPHGYFYLGQAYLYQEKWKQAATEFLRALDHGFPDNERLSVQLAYAQSEAGACRQALDRLEGARRPARPPLAAQYDAVRAYAHGCLNEPQQAVEAIQRAIALEPANPEHRTFLINALIGTGQFNQALGEAITAQRKFPDSADLQYLFGLASYHVTQTPFTKLARRNLAELEPDSPRVLLLEGLEHRKRGRTEESNRAFRSAADRGVQDAHVLLGLLAKEDGDYEGAERELREAERLNPRNGQTALELGKLLAIRQELAEARDYLEKAARYLPANPVVHYQLGLVYARLGETEKAQTHTRLFRELEQAAKAQVNSASAPGGDN